MARGDTGDYGRFSNMSRDELEREARGSDIDFGGMNDDELRAALHRNERSAGREGTPAE